MKRPLFYLVGLIVLALGVSSVIAAELGAGAWDAFYVGLSTSVGLTVGSWVIIVGTLLLILNGILLKKRPDVTGFISIVIVGAFIDIIYIFVFSNMELENIAFRILLFAVGTLCIAFGVATYLQAKFAPHPIDNLMLIVHKKFNLSISTARIICEIFALIMAIIFGGPVWYGTLVIAIVIGPCLQFAYKKMEKLYNSI